MKQKPVSLSKGDYQILESYKIMAEGLADYLGEGFEIVVQSLGNLEHSVIKILNGSHTGRKEGSPITDLGLTMVKNMFLFIAQLTWLGTNLANFLLQEHIRAMQTKKQLKLLPKSKAR